MGPDVITACLNCLNDDACLPGQNRTNIILIPKKSTPTSVVDLRPIFLSNVVDHVVCKAIANRLKHILPHVIFETQSVVLPQRIITNNIIIAYELFHSLKRRTQGHQSFLALKIDMSKVYDRIEWGYLQLI